MRGLLVGIVLVAMIAAGWWAAIAFGGSEAVEITDAEHDRLLSTCLSVADGDALCPGFIDGLVEEMEDHDCGYSEAAQALALVYELEDVDGRETTLIEADYDTLVEAC